MSDVRAELSVESLASLPSRTVDWLWRGRLARGKLAIFDGDPGLGKSLVTLDLCARITTGREFPDGSPGQGPGNVLIFHGEDAAEDVVNPRLDALGADRARVFHAQRLHQYGPEPLSFPGHVPLLQRVLEEVRPLLVVIDPIMAFLDRTVATGNDPSVRSVLAPLAHLAEAHNCVMILVRHLNKSAGKRSLYRGAGSMAFLAVCRSAWLFAKHPGKAGQTVMAQVKNNLAPPQPSLAYEMLTRAEGAPELRWCGPCDLEAADLLKWADGAYPARMRARDFLTSFLADGPRPYQVLWDAAQKLRIAKATLNRAKAELKVRSHRTMLDGRAAYYWLLDGHKPPLSTDPDIRAFEERLEEVHAQLPPRDTVDGPNDP
jgi:hypothetical protein